jgi:hypothetical protein
LALETDEAVKWYCLTAKNSHVIAGVFPPEKSIPNVMEFPKTSLKRQNGIVWLRPMGMKSQGCLKKL